MKKNNLIKVIGITFLILIMLSFFIKPSVVDGKTISTSQLNSIGIIGFAQVFYTFISQNLDVLVLVVMVGIMYGVLNKTDAYQQLTKHISNKFKNKEKFFVLISVLMFSILSSVFGLQIELFIFVPLVSAILMHLGYDKKTVFASTIGSIIIGTLGATFNSVILSPINIYYNLTYTSQIFTKSFILIMVLFLYITHVLKRAEVLEDIEYLEIPNYEKPIAVSRKKLPMVLYIIVIFILTFIGVFKLGDIAGIELFATIRENLMNIAIFKIILGEIPVFGSLGYIDLAYMLFLSSLIIGFIYSVKFDDMIDGMYKGASRVFPAAIILLIVSTIPTISTNYSFYLTIVGKTLSLFSNFNIFISTVATFITALFVPNISLGAVQLMPLINATMASDINASSLIVQTIYGLVMLIAPTSSLLMFGLSYYKINYTEWIKYIFKLFLYILIVLMAIFIIVVLI